MATGSGRHHRTARPPFTYLPIDRNEEVWLLLEEKNAPHPNLHFFLYVSLCVLFQKCWLYFITSIHEVNVCSALYILIYKCENRLALVVPSELIISLIDSFSNFSRKTKSFTIVSIILDRAIQLGICYLMYSICTRYDFESPTWLPWIFPKSNIYGWHDALLTNWCLIIYPSICFSGSIGLYKKHMGCGRCRVISSVLSPHGSFFSHYCFFHTDVLFP